MKQSELKLLGTTQREKFEALHNQLRQLYIDKRLTRDKEKKFKLDLRIQMKKEQINDIKRGIQ